jgi:hypothetical protein
LIDDCPRQGPPRAVVDDSLWAVGIANVVQAITSLAVADSRRRRAAARITDMRRRYEEGTIMSLPVQLFDKTQSGGCGGVDE